MMPHARLNALNGSIAPVGKSTRSAEKEKEGRKGRQKNGFYCGIDDLRRDDNLRLPPTSFSPYCV